MYKVHVLYVRATCTCMYVEACDVVHSGCLLLSISHSRACAWQTADEHDSELWTPAPCSSWCAETSDGTQWRGEGGEGSEWRGEGGEWE